MALAAGRPYPRRIEMPQCGLDAVSQTGGALASLPAKPQQKAKLCELSLILDKRSFFSPPSKSVDSGEYSA